MKLSELVGSTSASERRLLQVENFVGNGLDHKNLWYARVHKWCVSYFDLLRIGGGGDALPHRFQEFTIDQNIE